MRPRRAAQEVRSSAASSASRSAPTSPSSRIGSCPTPLPQPRVDAREQVAGRGVPRPAQVADELAERGERLGQDGADGEPADRAHGGDPSDRSTRVRTARGVLTSCEHAQFLAAPDTGSRRRLGYRSRPMSSRARGLRHASRSATSARSRTAAAGRPRPSSGETFAVTATVFREGHDAVAANVVLRGPTGAARRPGPRCTGSGPSPTAGAPTSRPTSEGDWTYQVEAWSDPVAHLAARAPRSRSRPASTSSWY